MASFDQKRFYEFAGARLREVRGKRLTQEELGNSAGLSRVSVVNIEAGRQKLLLHHVFTLATALGLSPAELITLLQPVTSGEPDLSSAGDAAEFVRAALLNLSQGAIPHFRQ